MHKRKMYLYNLYNLIETNRPFFWGVCPVTVGVSSQGGVKLPMFRWQHSPVFGHHWPGYTRPYRSRPSPWPPNSTPRISDGWVEKPPKCCDPNPWGDYGHLRFLLQTSLNSRIPVSWWIFPYITSDMPTEVLSFIANVPMLFPPFDRPLL